MTGFNQRFTHNLENLVKTNLVLKHKKNVTTFQKQRKKSNICSKKPLFATNFTTKTEITSEQEAMWLTY